MPSKNVKFTEVDNHQGSDLYTSAIPYEFQAPYDIFLDNQMMKFELGELVTDHYMITRLLELKAPISPRNPDEIKVFRCPHCAAEIFTDQIPVLQRWIERLLSDEKE